MTAVNTDSRLYRAFDSWARATLDVIVVKVHQNRSNASFEVRCTDMQRASETVANALIDTVLDRDDAAMPAAEACLGFRALADLLVAVADELDDEELAA
jgi:hypothetical protein